MTPKLALFLRDYQAERERLYQALGKPLGLDDLVFGSHEGNPLDPSVLSHGFARIVKRAGLENVRFTTSGIPSPVLCFYVGQSLRLSVKPWGMLA